MVLFVDKYIKRIFSDLITVFHQLSILIRVGFFTCGNRFGSIIHCVCFTVVKMYFYLKPVGSWRIYIIMVMITIINGGQCHIWRYS